MERAYGERARARRFSARSRHNTVYYPNLTIKGAIQAIRVVRPIAVDKTLIESWTFRLVGAPEELLQRTTMYTGSSTRRSRWSATTTCTATAASRRAGRRAATSG